MGRTRTGSAGGRQLQLQLRIAGVNSCDRRDRLGHVLSGSVLYSVLYATLWCAQPYMPYSQQRLRHFADWSDNSSEYHILREVEHNFITTFLEAEPREDRGSAISGDEGIVVCPTGERERVCSLEQWLSRWGLILDKAKTFSELPVWLQYFPRVMFAVVNKSGTGVVSRDELSAFYSSVLGLGAQRVGEILDSAYKAMTANGDHPLCFPAYRWCYANFLLGRHRNGPGQYLFGPGEPADLRSCPFPVDYSALNTAPEELEQYSPDRKSNRRSVIV